MKLIYQNPFFAMLLRFICTAPNLLTLSRIVLALYAAGAILSKNWQSAAVFAIVAAITDFFDGWCARALGQTSPLGALLDPIADKFFVFSLIIALYATLPELLPFWLFMVILVRESLIFLGGVFLCVVYRCPITVQPTIWGKIATFLEMVCICMWILKVLFPASPVAVFCIPFSALLCGYLVATFFHYCIERASYLSFLFFRC